MRLDSGQRTDGIPRLQLDVHLFAVDGQLPDGRFNIGKHTLVTLEFEAVDEIDLNWFGAQNVLWELGLEEVNDPAEGSQLQVALPSSAGMEASFKCRTVTVVAVVPFQPGEHSVYQR